MNQNQGPCSDQAGALSAPADSAGSRFSMIVTMGYYHIVMGRKTYESINRLLPGRTTVIVTRQPGYQVRGAVVAHSLREAIASCNADHEVFVIGGGELYRQALSIADRIYLTTVDAEPTGDTFMPDVDLKNWRETSSEEFCADPQHPYAYRFSVYDRAQP